MNGLPCHAVPASASSANVEFVALSQDSLDALFTAAMRDARLARPAVLLAARVRPAGWPDDREAFYRHPGPGDFTWRDLTEPDLRDAANAAKDAHRVVILVDEGVDEQTALGLMAWNLEVASQWERSPAFHDFGLFLARAIERRYVGTGLGSASVYHRIPIFRDANAAAARLVDRVYGRPQLAEYFAAHGNLLRPIGEPEPDTLAQRLVVFGLQHRSDVVARAEAEGIALDRQLAELHENAPVWWRQLASDSEFVRSCQNAASLIPTAEAIAKANPPIRAWWPLLARLDHDEDVGLAVLQSR